MIAYPDANRWFSTHQVQIASVDPDAIEGVGAITNKRPVTYQRVEQKTIINAYLPNEAIIGILT